MSNLYIYEQGSVLTYKENRLIVTDKTETKNSIPIENIDNIVMFGAIQVTTPCMQNLLSRGIHLTWLSKNGSYFGRLESTRYINIERQRMQFRKGDDSIFCLELSKQFIKGKTTNQRTILVRGNREIKNPDMQIIIDKIARNIKRIDTIKSIDGLMGIEGYIARLYYQAINMMLTKEFSFEKRTKRPPKDPFNSIISFGYTLLHYEIFTILLTKGLNPYASFLHSDRHKHPALCSDLMEEWRPILIDSLAMALLNNKKLKLEDFDYDEETGGVFLNKKSCKKFVEEFEKRLRQEVGYIEEISYKMSFRRMIEYQVMQLIKAMESDKGELYKPVLIR